MNTGSQALARVGHGVERVGQVGLAQGLGPAKGRIEAASAKCALPIFQRAAPPYRLRNAPGR
jgi:hypothetical protein